MTILVFTIMVREAIICNGFFGTLSISIYIGFLLFFRNKKSIKNITFLTIFTVSFFNSSGSNGNINRILDYLSNKT